MTDKRTYLPILWGVLFLAGLYLTSFYNYLLFHSLAEMFSIVIACCIFILAWNSRRFMDNTYLLFLGIAYLFIGALDLMHTLAYTGMGIFRGYGTNLPTQLWISARYIESLSLLLAPLFLGRKLKVNEVFLGYVLVALLVLSSIFSWNIFPTCFVDGTGLTPFKKISEYVISLILVGAIALLVRSRRDFETDVLHLLIGSIVLTIFAELVFTFYVHAYGLSNLVGHYLKIFSFYFIYRAIIQTGLTRPYALLFRNLKKSENRLRESEEKYRSMMEAMNDPVYICTPDYRVGYMNPAMIRKTGRDATGEPCYKAIHGQEEKCPWCVHEQVQRGESLDTKVLSLTDGHSYHIAHSPIFHVDGLISKMTIFRDITWEKQVQEELRAERDFTTAVLSTAGALVIVLDRQGCIVRFNRACEKLTGYKFEEVSGRPLWDLFLIPEELKSVKAAFDDLRSGNLPSEHENCWVARDGTQHLIMWSNTVLIDDRGLVTHVIGTGIDITKRRAAEKALQESEERFRQLAENIREVFWVGSPDWKTVFYVSPAYEELWGQSCENLYDSPMSWLDNVFEDDLNLVIDQINKRAVGNFSRVEFPEYRIVQPDGCVRWILARAFPITNKSGDVYRVAGIAEDITERKEAEDMLKKAHQELEKRVNERTAELSAANRLLREEIDERKRAQDELERSEGELKRLSSQLLSVQEDERKRIARDLHDSIGQSLAAVKFAAESALEKMRQGSIQESIDAMGDLIPVVKLASEEVRRIHTDLRPSLLDDLGIEATIGWFCREFEKLHASVEIEKQILIEEEGLEEDLKLAIFRVLQEALNNVVKHAKADMVFVSLTGSDEKIELVVRDNGLGFDLGHALSEKGPSKGLGLTSMRERAELTGGFFSIESNRGSGTSLRVSWPHGETAPGS